jgi:hypothetical protein
MSDSKTRRFLIVKSVAACKQDPTLPAYAAEIETRRKFRKGANLPQKASYTDAQRDKLSSEIAKAKGHLVLLGESRKRNAVDDGEGGTAPKKRRQCADKQLAALSALGVGTYVGSGRRRRGSLADENSEP